MKKIFLIILSLFYMACNDSSSPFKSPDNNETEIPPLTQKILDKYYSDAAYLVYAELIKDSLLKETQVNLDLDKIDKIYQDFILIHQKGDKLGKTFLKYFLQVTNVKAFEMYNIFAKADTSKVWLQRIIDGYHDTGLESIDSVLSAYNLIINSRLTTTFDGGYHLSISSSLPHNNFALSNKIMSSGEFIYVSPNGLFGDAGSLTYSNMSGVRVYTYRIGWGDCEAGCIFNHYWEVSVDINNEVSLLNEYGADLPPSGN